jgi:hypothetical protein
LAISTTLFRAAPWRIALERLVGGRLVPRSRAVGVGELHQHDRPHAGIALHDLGHRVHGDVMAAVLGDESGGLREATPSAARSLTSTLSNRK